MGPSGPLKCTVITFISMPQKTLGTALILLAPSVTYPEFFWADRLHLVVLPLSFHPNGWQKFLNLVPPDALKMHSLAMPPWS